MIIDISLSFGERLGYELEKYSNSLKDSIFSSKITVISENYFLSNIHIMINDKK
jgi:hypothetical protein